MNASFSFNGRLGLQQRVLPLYRTAFFDHLAEVCERGLSVYAGPPRAGEGIHPASELNVAHLYQGRNLHLLRGQCYLCLQVNLLSWLKQWDPDALIMEANPRFPFSRSAIAWMHSRKRPVVGWGLGAPRVEGMTGSVRSVLRRSFLSRFDALIAYSEQGASEYASLGFPQDRIVVAHNAVAFAPQRRPERPSISGRQLQIISIGRLQARKRVDLLLKACARLDPKPHLRIVGDGPERGALESLAKDVFPQTVFTGPLFDEDLEKVLIEADLFVLPGTGGLAVQQAMAAALPVIVAEGDGTQNDLVSHENGWLIPANDLSALVASLKSARQDVDRLREMGKHSYDLVVKRFNIDAMRTQFLQALALGQEVV